MTTDFEREIRAAFADVVPAGADPDLAARIRARVAETSVIRRGPGSVLRGDPAAAVSRWAVAAVVLVVAVGGALAIPFIGRVGESTPSPNPGQLVGGSPAASPSAAPSASPSAAPSTGTPSSTASDASAPLSPPGITIPVHKDMFGDVDIQKIRLVTDQVGWVAAGSRLYRTADGGRTWTDVGVPLSGPGGALAIDDVETAYVQVDSDPITIASTHDDGATWTTSTIVDGLANAGLALGFATPQVGAAIFLNGDASGTLHIYRTADGGRSWTGPTVSAVPDRQGKMDPTGASVQVVNASDNNHFWLSTDWGQTWKRLQLPVDDVSPAGVPKGLLGSPWVGVSGQIVLPIRVNSSDAVYESTDDGRSWRLIKAWPEPRHADFRWQAISANAWVLSTIDGAEFWSTTDGGAHWRRVQWASPIEELSTSWASPDHGWAFHGCALLREMPELGSDRYCEGTDLKSVLLETTDGGRTWSKIGG